MLIIIKDFFTFLRFNGLKASKSNNIFLWLISGYVLLLSFKIFLITLKTTFTRLNLITSTDGAGSPEQWIAETSIYTFALQVAILAPILEEFAFRGILIQNKKIIKFSVIVILYMLICTVTKTSIYTLSTESVIILASCTFLTLLFENIITSNVQEFTRNNLKWLVYFNSVLFALWHYGNFDFTKADILTTTFTLLPYFISGLVFSWFAMRKGFEFGLLLHFMNNLVPVIIAFINHK